MLEKFLKFDSPLPPKGMLKLWGETGEEITPEAVYGITFEAAYVKLSISPPGLSIRDIFREAEMQLSSTVLCSPSVHFGKPCIAGTRVPVFAILDSLEEGLSIEEVASNYPGISDGQVKSAIRFASVVCRYGVNSEL